MCTRLSDKDRAQIAEECAPGGIGPEFGWTQRKGIRCKHCHGPAYEHPSLHNFWGCPKDGVGYDVAIHFEQVAPAREGGTAASNSAC